MENPKGGVRHVIPEKGREPMDQDQGEDGKRPGLHQEAFNV
jgi:hypothetical protein